MLTQLNTTKTNVKSYVAVEEWQYQYDLG